MDDFLGEEIFPLRNKCRSISLPNILDVDGVDEPVAKAAEESDSQNGSRKKRRNSPLLQLVSYIHGSNSSNNQSSHGLRRKRTCSVENILEGEMHAASKYGIRSTRRKKVKNSGLLTSVSTNKRDSVGPSPIYLVVNRSVSALKSVDAGEQYQQLLGSNKSLNEVCFNFLYYAHLHDCTLILHDCVSVLECVCVCVCVCMCVCVCVCVCVCMYLCIL